MENGFQQLFLGDHLLGKSFGSPGDAWMTEVLLLVRFLGLVELVPIHYSITTKYKHDRSPSLFPQFEDCCSDDLSSQDGYFRVLFDDR